MNETLVPPLPPKLKKSPLKSHQTVLSSERTVPQDIFQFQSQDLSVPLDEKLHVVKIQINPTFNNNCTTFNQIKQENFKSTTIISSSNENQANSIIYNSLNDNNYDSTDSASTTSTTESSLKYLGSSTRFDFNENERNQNNSAIHNENVPKFISENRISLNSTTFKDLNGTKLNFENNVKDKPKPSVICEPSPCIRISVNSENMEVPNYNFFYGNFENLSNLNTDMSSGQISPSDTLDSGTCSDMDGTPPPLPKKKSPGVSVTLIGASLGSHRRAPSSSSGAEVDSDDNESSISCDSLTSGKFSPTIGNLSVKTSAPKSSSFLPLTLLQDIRNLKFEKEEPKALVDEKSYEERKQEQLNSENMKAIENMETIKNIENILNSEKSKIKYEYESDIFYNFHINEHDKDNNTECVKKVSVPEDESFAGYKDILGEGAATIRSAKGTVRGVKNRVRAGIATFLQINNTAGKSYKEKDAGKVVVYTTTMGILRETYQACMQVKQILRTLLVKFEERDVFMSNEYQQEIQERMRCDHILVPQVFVDGQHVGDAETIERLNETGELRRILKPFKSADACIPCKSCGGYRLLPCSVCNGSKKSVHRNHFTAEFVALKCMNCDEVGLVRCTLCN